MWLSYLYVKEMTEDNSTGLLTKPEKEKKVIELLKQGKTFIQIAKVVHMSFGNIGRIKRNLIGEREGGKG
jgi:DNA-binding NarL/FixJ family response regulator